MIRQLDQARKGKHRELVAPAPPSTTDFVRAIVATDLQNGRHGGRVVTRFPPEPNGYLHIGHAKSICLNFGIAEENGGICHLRYDDTNPAKEEVEYIDAIQEDVRWLGFDWGSHRYFASDYFERFYEYALELIDRGLAYVDDLSPQQIREYRGTPTQPGVDSPYRNRTAQENRQLFARMRAGEFQEGACVLRAKIDMASPNINLRDPALYRIKKIHHHRTQDQWCIYPMYDYAHPISDAIEGISHSICTLEFEDHRPFYDWLLDHLSVTCHPQQVEFARLNLTYTVMSKRKLLQLVTEGHVRGWDDPRMPTISGLRRRGYTASSIRRFCEIIGVSKANSIVDIALLEHCLREDLNLHCERRMAVLHPLKVVVSNYPAGQTEWFAAENNPEDPAAGSRMVPFTREIYIEREDFAENPPPKYFRLAPGREIRLKHAYYITCTDVIKNSQGEVVEVHCTYDPESRGGGTPDQRVVRGTSHWVSAAHARDGEVRLYDQLFKVPNPGDQEDFAACLNPNSLSVLSGCKLEPSLAESKVGDRFQFLRQGYYCLDPDARPDRLVFNRTVGLRDTWAKVARA